MKGLATVDMFSILNLRVMIVGIWNQAHYKQRLKKNLGRFFVVNDENIDIEINNLSHKVLVLATLTVSVAVSTIRNKNSVNKVVLESISNTKVFRNLVIVLTLQTTTLLMSRDFS